EGRGMGLRVQRGLLGGRSADVLVSDRGPHRDSGSGHGHRTRRAGGLLPRVPRQQDGPPPGGPEVCRDRRRRRRAGLLPAVLLVAAVVRLGAGGVCARRRVRLVAAAHRRRLRQHRARRLGVRVLPRRARAL
ncbi:MAG: Cytochrome c oxidase polypeptide IV, partial [uncultured Nocardioidaceae bacterium]